MARDTYWTKSGRGWAHSSVSRRMFVRGTTLGVAGLAGAALIGCSGGSKPSAPASGGGAAGAVAPASKQPKTGGTLRVAAVADLLPNAVPSSLNDANRILYRAVLDTLVRFRPNEFVAEPQLADSWEFNGDFTKLTFRLKKGVKFHNGKPFTSQSVVDNLKRGADPKFPSSVALFIQWIKKMETPDDTTLSLTLDKPRPSMLDLFEDLYIVEPSTFTDAVTGKAFIGTGPFQFKDWQSGNQYSMVKNPAYHMPTQAYLDGINVSIIPDQSAQLIHLKSNNADLVFNPLLNEAQSLVKDQKYQVLSPKDFTSGWYVGIDLTAPSMADVRVRQAIAWAIDRKRIVDTAFYGFGEAKCLLWPKDSPAYDAKLENAYTYDLTKAKQLLAAAGVSNLSIPFTVSELYPQTHGIAEILQSDLAGLGIKVSVNKLQHAAYLPLLSGAKFKGLWSGSLSFMSMTPATMFISAFPMRVPNASNFDSPKYRELLDTISIKPSSELKDAYRELNQYFIDQAFVLPVTPNQAPVIANLALRGYVRGRKGYPVWDGMWLDR